MSIAHELDVRVVCQRRPVHPLRPGAGPDQSESHGPTLAQHPRRPARAPYDLTGRRPLSIGFTNGVLLYKCANFAIRYTAYR